MKKLLFLILLLIPLVSCQKKEADPVFNEQDVVFNAMEIIPSQGLKSTELWECKDLEPDYAHITINGLDYFPALFSLDGKLYTQAIKLPPGDYTVSQFLLMDDGGTPRNVDITDDQIVHGIPEAASAYAIYVIQTPGFHGQCFIFYQN